MSRSHTVGLLAPNGRLGANILTALLKYHEQGKIGLVVLHRPGSPPKTKLPASVDVREVDLEGDVKTIVPAVKGINVLISAIAAQESVRQTIVVEALAQSPDIVTFIPALFGHNWDGGDLVKSPIFSQMYVAMGSASAKAAELGVGITEINAGLFDEFFFSFGFAGFNLPQNTIQANAAILANEGPLVTMAYLGEGIAQIATRDPNSIKSQHYSLVEYWATGNEFVDVFTRVNGAKPTIKDLSDEELETMRVTPPMGPVAAAYLTAWGTNKWNYKDPQEVEGWKTKSLEEVAAVWKQ